MSANLHRTGKNVKAYHLRHTNRHGIVESCASSRRKDATSVFGVCDAYCRSVNEEEMTVVGCDERKSGDDEFND